MLITEIQQVNRITIGKECSAYKSPAWQRLSVNIVGGRFINLVITQPSIYRVIVYFLPCHESLNY